MKVRKFLVDMWNGRTQQELESYISDVWNGRTGVGDAVKIMIDTASKGKIKQCGGCIKRQQYLNELFSKSKKNINRRD